MVGLRSRGLLGLDLGFLRGQGTDPVSAGARLARDARRAVVHRRPAQLRRAHARHRRGPRPGRRGRPIADPRPARADLRRVARPGCAGAGGPAAAGHRRGRSGRRLHAEHPRDPGRLSRHDQPRRDLGLLRHRVRPSQRDRPLRRPRAEAAAGDRRLSLRREADRPPRRGRRGARRASRARARGPRPLRGRRGGLPARRRGVGGAAGRSRAARVRPGAVRPSPLRAVLLRHDRQAEGDRAPPRRHPSRASQEPGPELGPAAWRPPDVVHDHRLDDVERAGLDPAVPGLDRDARRQPALSRPDARNGGSPRSCGRR